MVVLHKNLYNAMGVFGIFSVNSPKNYFIEDDYLQYAISVLEVCRDEIQKSKSQIGILSFTEKQELLHFLTGYSSSLDTLLPLLFQIEDFRVKEICIDFINQIKDLKLTLEDYFLDREAFILNHKRYTTAVLMKEIQYEM